MCEAEEELGSPWRETWRNFEKLDKSADKFDESIEKLDESKLDVTPPAIALEATVNFETDEDNQAIGKEKKSAVTTDTGKLKLNTYLYCK